MSKKVGNKALSKAKEAKEDEFYTQLTDIEKELKHYKKHFKNKVVFCNCDDPRVSQFFHYFTYNFEKLGLKKLITTCYKSKNGNAFTKNADAQGISLVYTGDKNNSGVPDPEEVGIVPLEGDGDFRSNECVELLKEADIVVTNPPFSLFREYVAQLIEHKKKFLIVGNQNAVTYIEIFPLLKSNQIWLGVTNGDMAFKVPDSYEPRETRYWQDEKGQKWRSLGNSCWFTNLDNKKRHEELVLFKTYTPEEFPTYDNYPAIEVGKTQHIPKDYKGVMGVPITFLNKFNPDQFELLGTEKTIQVGGTLYVKGVAKYKRILIRHKKSVKKKGK